MTQRLEFLDDEINKLKNDTDITGLTVKFWVGEDELQRKYLFRHSEKRHLFFSQCWLSYHSYYKSDRKFQTTKHTFERPQNMQPLPFPFLLGESNSDVLTACDMEIQPKEGKHGQLWENIQEMSMYAMQYCRHKQRVYFPPFWFYEIAQDSEHSRNVM